jgi:tRNA G18 (ribose-2'-O)-methylase SpoU
MMPTVRIDSLDDPRVSSYRNLKDHELDCAGKLFIAEGEHVVRRLLGSDFPVESVMLDERRVAEFAPVVPEHVQVYVVAAAVMTAVLGFRFHSGVIACGRRKAPPPLGQFMRELSDRRAPRITLVICPDINNVENIGSLVRLSAGFGVDGMILGPQCHDPFWRQSIRVSMGTVFKLPILRSADLLADMRLLREEWGVQLAATVIGDDAEGLKNAVRPDRFGLLFGGEAQGLSGEYVAACERRITIPMKLGTDSLNVAVAAGIFLYQFTE